MLFSLFFVSLIILLTYSITPLSMIHSTAPSNIPSQLVSMVSSNSRFSAPTLSSTSVSLTTTPQLTNSNIKHAIGIYLKDNTNSPYYPISSWNTSLVTNLDRLFGRSKSHKLTNFTDNIGNWDVSNVTSMSHMFWNAQEFNSNLSQWDVGKVTDLSGTFSNTRKFHGNINSWDVSQVTDMSYMFSYAHKFNSKLNKWNVINVTNIAYMFHHADTFNQPINTWDVSNVRFMNYTFWYTPQFNQSLMNWNTRKVVTMEGMFGSSINFNGRIQSWNVSQVTSMKHMFVGAYNFRQSLCWNVNRSADTRDMFVDSKGSLLRYPKCKKSTLQLPILDGKDAKNNSLFDKGTVIGIIAACTVLILTIGTVILRRSGELIQRQQVETNTNQYDLQLNVSKQDNNQKTEGFQDVTIT